MYRTPRLPFADHNALKPGHRTGANPPPLVRPTLIGSSSEQFYGQAPQENPSRVFNSNADYVDASFACCTRNLSKRQRAIRRKPFSRHPCDAPNSHHQ